MRPADVSDDPSAERTIPRQSASGPGRGLLRGTRRVAAMLALAAIPLFAVACGGDDDTQGGDSGAELSEVRVALIPLTPWMPAMIADAKGFFEKNGLDVEITEVQAQVNAATGRQFDIAQATGPDFLNAVNGGLDQVLVSNVAQETERATALMVQGDSDIDSLEDLAGTRVGGVGRESAIAQSLMFLLTNAGVDLESVTFQEGQFPAMPDQLASGQVDVITPVEPFATQAEAGGARRILNPILEAGREAGYTGPIPVLFAASSREWAESHPDEIEAWRKSLQEAAAFIKSNEQEARQILQEFVGLPPEVAQNTPLFRHDTGAVAPEQIGLWLEILEGAGSLPESTDLEPDQLVFGG